MSRNVFVAVGLVGLLAAAFASDALAGEKKTVLIYGRTYGFRHGGSIDKGGPILKAIAEGLGYKAVISEDPAVFDADKVGQWNLIIFNNCTGGLNPKEPERREALMKRIKEGGAGFMGFHAATDCNYNWPEYGKMINGYFAGHPWHQVVHTRVEEPEHPLMAPFGKGPFIVRDEIYQFRNYKRSNARILMSIDTRSVPVERGNRKDRDYAICWIRPWGKGRIFYNAHGHAENVFQNKTFQEHVKLAMQWAIGDIEVDTTPSPEIDRSALAAKAVESLRKAKQDDEIAQALGILSWCPHPQALPLVVAQFGRSQQVASAAADATQAIIAKAEELPKAQKIDILKKALPLALNRNTRRGIRTQLRALGVTDLPIHVPPGYIAHWWVAGPLPSTRDHKAYDQAFPPESGVDLKAGFEVDGKQYAWKLVETDDDGILDLNRTLKRASNVAAYMYAEVTVEKATPAEIRLGSDDAFVVWVNGQRVGGRKVNRALRPASDRFRATLSAGANRILMKVCQGGGDWSGCLQIVAPGGGRLEFTARTK